MPPYSCGRWGAHRPSERTFSLTCSRSSRASARASSVISSPERPRFQSAASLGRMCSLMMAAVRSRMSLMRSSSVGIGVTLIDMGAPLAGASCATGPHLDPWVNDVPTGTGIARAGARP